MNNKNKIIVVDDDKDFLKELEEVLSSRNYDVRAVNDSQVAVAAARSFRPDVIVLDLKMDNINGFQVAQELKKFPETCNTPVIAITGFFNSEGHQMLMRVCGIETFLSKPFKVADLIGRIETHLDMSRIKKQEEGCGQKKDL